MTFDPAGDWRQLDPGLEEVLRDIASKQEARLLRVSRSTTKTRAALFSSDTMVSSRMAGLLSAERKLLETYRDEVAYLLRCLALQRVMEVPVAQRQVSLYHGQGKRLHLPPPSRLRRRIGQQKQDLIRSFPDDIAALCLGEAARVADDLPADTVQLALASFKLVPNDHCRLYIAQERYFSGSYRTALAEFAFLAKNATTFILQARARGWAACALSQLRAYERAHGEFSAACASGLGSPADVASSVSMAVQAGDVSLVLRSAHRAEDLLADEHEALAAWTKGVVKDRQAGGWIPSTRSRLAIHRVSDRVGPVSTRILDVFA